MEANRKRKKTPLVAFLQHHFFKRFPVCFYNTGVLKAVCKRGAVFKVGFAKHALLLMAFWQ